MIFVGQTNLRIKIKTGLSLQSVFDVKIKYINPDGKTGEWHGNVLDAAGGIIFYDILSPTELDVAGDWKVWAYITFSDMRAAPGITTKMVVGTEGVN